MPKNEILVFITENKEMVFSGLGLAVGSAAVVLIKYFRSHQDKDAAKQAST
jgi:hypothetical protein